MSLWSRVVNVFRSERVNRDIDEELRSHLAEAIEEGRNPAEARQAFGSLERQREVIHRLRVLPWLDSLRADTIFGWRQLRRYKVTSCAAILSVALGIGLNTSVFSLLDQLVLRLLPVTEPQQLVMVWTTGPHFGGNSGFRSASYPMCQDLQRKAEAFSYVFCRFDTTVTVSLNREGAEEGSAELVSGNFFQALGVDPALGRVFHSDTDDQVYEGHPSLVLSHRYWVTRFGGDPHILGRKIQVNNHWMEIVGVAAPGFPGLDPSRSPDFWVPILMKPWMSQGRDDLANRRSQWVQIFARMKPGYSVESAQASLEALLHQILMEEINQPALSSLSAFDRQRFLSRKVLVERAASGYSDLRREYATALNVLMAMAVLALLIVCSNVANLLLARASARQQEMAVRLAIGAPRRALVRQLLIESLLLALIGAGLGLGVATFGTRALLRMLPQRGASLALHAAPDWRVLLFSLAIATVTGLLFGFAPAVQSAKPAIRGGLHAAPAEISGRTSSRTRSLLVAIQLALSFLLLVGAALFTRTLTNLKEVRTGFTDLKRVVSFQVDPGRAGYTLPRIRTLYSAVLNDIQAVPKVKSAAYSMWPLLNGERWDLTVMVEGHKAAPGENMQSLYNVISPGFFQTVGVPLLQGRDFTENDRFEGNDPALVPKVAIVNRAFAERFFANQSPIGRHIGCCRGTATSEDIEIVGMVENSVVGSPRQEVESEVFFSYLQSTIPRTVTFYVRSDEDENFVARAARSAFARYDNTLPLFAVKTVETQVEETLSTEQMIASLSTVFGALAAVLAGIGLYGVLAFAVGLRTKEIALRIALGSSRKSVLWLVLRGAFAMLAGGLTAGILAAAVLSRYIASQLFGVHPTNAWIYTEVVFVLGLITLAASLLPARQASAANPLNALRNE